MKEGMNEWMKAARTRITGLSNAVGFHVESDVTAGGWEGGWKG